MLFAGNTRAVGGGGGGIEYSHIWVRFAIVVELVIVSEVFSPQIGYHLLSLFTLIKTGYLPIEKCVC